MSCVYNGKDHNLQELMANGAGFPGGLNVARWCCNCGAVVVDVDVDGRVRPGEAVAMKFPRIALERTSGVSASDAALPGTHQEGASVPLLGGER